MKYQDAFILAIKTYSVDILDDNFLIYSFLLDHVGDSFEGKELIEAFFILNKGESIYNAIKGLSLIRSRTVIDKLIKQSDKCIPTETYIRSIEPLMVILFGDEYLKPKANKPPKHHIESVRIFAKCRKLAIDFGYSNKFEVIDEYGNISEYNSDDKEIKLLNTDGDYQIMLPKSVKKELSINFKGESLDIGKHMTKNKHVEQVKIKSKGGSLHICNLNSSKILISIKDGYVSLGGFYDVIDVRGTSTPMFVWPELGVNEVNLNNTSGEIFLWIGSERAKPKVNHWFKRTKSVTGSYCFGGHRTYLSINSTYGKVRVR